MGSNPALAVDLFQHRETTVIFFFLGGGGGRGGVPQLYLWGSPLLGEIFAHVTVFLIQPLR